MKKYGLTTQEVKRFAEMSKAMNDPRLDDTWEQLDTEFKRRKQESREWFNNLLKIAIVCMVIQLIVLVFCVWYLSK